MKCEICDKEFGSYRSLNGHMRMHGTSNGTSRKKRKIHDNNCDHCGMHVNKRREGNNNRFCNIDCFQSWKWENVNKPKVLAGNTGQYSHHVWKRYLVEIYGDNCSECGGGNTWNGKPLTIQIDHIDGDSDNNNINNLCLLCPNCHTQTDTYGSKGRGSRYRKDAERNKYLRKYKGYMGHGPDGKASALHAGDTRFNS